MFFGFFFRKTTTLQYHGFKIEWSNAFMIQKIHSSLFFCSGISFADTDDSQYNREREGAIQHFYLLKNFQTFFCSFASEMTTLYYWAQRMWSPDSCIRRFIFLWKLAISYHLLILIETYYSHFPQRSGAFEHTSTQTELQTEIQLNTEIQTELLIATA